MNPKDKEFHHAKRGLLYVHSTQTILSTQQGTTIINVGSMDYLCNKMLTQLLEEGLVEQITDKPYDTFVFDERDEDIIQHYLGKKNEFLDTTFIAAMT